MAPAREAVRRALAILAMPQNVPLALRIGWRTADVMWRIAGDTSTDFNHYTKRMTLGAVYGSTLLVWLDDQSEGLSETAAFLDRRIDNVMSFEKWKARVARLVRAPAQHFALPRAAPLPAAVSQSADVQIPYGYVKTLMIITRKNERTLRSWDGLARPA